MSPFGYRNAATVQGLGENRVELSQGKTDERVAGVHVYRDGMGAALGGVAAACHIYDQRRIAKLRLEGRQFRFKRLTHEGYAVDAAFQQLSKTFGGKRGVVSDTDRRARMAKTKQPRPFFRKILHGAATGTVNIAANFGAGSICRQRGIDDWW